MKFIAQTLKKSMVLRGGIISDFNVARNSNAAAWKAPGSTRLRQDTSSVACALIMTQLRKNTQWGKMRVRKFLFLS